MSGTTIIVWGLGILVLLRGTQYLLIARTYLTCAARRLTVQTVAREELPSDDREILDSVHQLLSSAGFTCLFTGETPPFLTLYDRPEYLRLYVSERQPFRVEVRRRPIPETGAVVTLQLETPLENGRTLITSNSPSAEILTLPATEVEAMPDAELSALETRHMERLAACGSRAVATPRDPVLALSEATRASQGLSVLFRQKGYTKPTPDPNLDRFTLRGAFGLAHVSLKMAAHRKKVHSPPVTRAATEQELQMRVIADARAVLGIALHPVRAPESSAPLWAIMMATALLSFAGMSYLWNPMTAAIILAVIAFHEAGHAMAMRHVGYRDVNVFFVPLLGALTIGRDAGTSVRNRLRVMLAGPVPGLWLAVVILLFQFEFGYVRLLTAVVFALLAINALNLLPITPFDGGRALELLTRPESGIRVVIQMVSGLALLALGARFGDAVLIVLGVLWLGLVRRQFALYRFRRAVGAVLIDRTDQSAVVRAVCGVFASPTYVSWRGSARLATARAVAQQFSGVQLEPGDRLHGAFAYAFAWIPVAIALVLWKR